MKKINNKIKRKLRNRKKLKKVNINRYRVSVSKSLKNIFVQIIDDKQKKNFSFCLINRKRNKKKIKQKKQKNLV